jgi:hypothetical protein
MMQDQTKIITIKVKQFCKFFATITLLFLLANCQVEQETINIQSHIETVANAETVSFLKEVNSNKN